MKELHCPSCGTPFVRVTSGTSLLEKALTRLHVFRFRCQLCTASFRARRPGKRLTSQEFDRREYRRLRANLVASLVWDQPTMDALVSDISMGGCTLQATTPLPRGTFVKVLVRVPGGQPDIKIESAMISSIQPLSIGVKFLEVHPEDKPRMGQLVLDLLAYQQTHPGG